MESIIATLGYFCPIILPVIARVKIGDYDNHNLVNQHAAGIFQLHFRYQIPQECDRKRSPR